MFIHTENKDIKNKISLELKTEEEQELFANLKAKRIYGIFAFKWKFLKKFHLTPESFLEKVEACDSNRICDNYGTQYIATYPYRNSFSDDCKKDLEKVCRYMQKDKLYNFYKKQNE